MFSKEDVFFIKKTFELAKKAEGFTSPNPLVGAVLVKNKKIISTGFHKKAGFPHAEIEAIKKARENLKGTTLYVNLEPCCHFGRTPPCVDEIIRQRIKKVVIATKDPNPLVFGKSIKKLKEAGIEVKVGVCEKEARNLNEVFFKNMNERLPFIALKWAQSLDGKIRDFKNNSFWITEEETREYARKIRDKYDAVLIGAKTLINDNPILNGFKKTPFKIILSRELNFSLEKKIFKIPEKILIFTLESNKKKAEKFIKKGIKVFHLTTKNNLLPLKKILKIIYHLGIMSVYIEGGSFTLTHFLEEKLVDRIYLFFALRFLGGNSALNALGGKGFLLKYSPYLEDINFKFFKKDFLITGKVKYKN